MNNPTIASLVYLAIGIACLGVAAWVVVYERKRARMRKRMNRYRAPPKPPPRVRVRKWD